jgi:hypothetical protein
MRAPYYRVIGIAVAIVVLSFVGGAAAFACDTCEDPCHSPVIKGGSPRIAAHPGPATIATGVSSAVADACLPVTAVASTRASREGSRRCLPLRV